jgi:hypothetical protein
VRDFVHCEVANEIVSGPTSLAHSSRKKTVYESNIFWPKLGGLGRGCGEFSSRCRAKTQHSVYLLR